MPEIRIGTSGWIYSHWRGDFYPRNLPVQRWFEHYQQHFDTVEINNTFYRLPPATTFDGWRKQAHGTFLYAVKANRFLTHMKKLKDPAEPLDRLLTHARRLRRHLGPVLYQLPPRWLPDGERLESFFQALPKKLTHVMEFRDERSLTDELRDSLARWNVGLCIHDMLRPHPQWLTSRAAYLRFHGVGYGGSYRRDRLRRWADWILRTASAGHDVYAYFNNDIGGHAVRNALTLKELVLSANTASGKLPHRLRI